MDFGNLPDGRIMYSTRGSHEGSDLMLADKDGSNPRTVRSFPALVTIGQISADGYMLICLQHQGGCTFQSIRTDGTDEHTITEWRFGESGGLSGVQVGSFCSSAEGQEANLIYGPFP